MIHRTTPFLTVTTKIIGATCTDCLLWGGHCSKGFMWTVTHLNLTAALCDRNFLPFANIGRGAVKNLLPNGRAVMYAQAGWFHGPSGSLAAVICDFWLPSVASQEAC